MIISRLFSRTGSFWWGFKLPFSAIPVIFSRPRLLLWSILPILITAGLYGFILKEIDQTLHPYIYKTIASWGIQSGDFLARVLSFLSRILVFIISAFTFSLVATVTSCPFNDFLAESVEPYTQPPLPAVPQRPWSGKLRLISIDLMKTVAAGIANISTLFISWVPVLNLFALLLTFLLVSFQFLSYPQTRRGWGLDQSVRFLWKHTYACAGFGASVTLLFAIPLVSCFCLPLAVVGGTLLFGRSQEPNLK